MPPSSKECFWGLGPCYAEAGQKLAGQLLVETGHWKGLSALCIICLLKKTTKNLFFFKEVTLKISKHYKKRLKEEKCKSFSSFSSVFKLTSLTNEELDKLKIVAFQGIRIEGKSDFWPNSRCCREGPLAFRRSLRGAASSGTGRSRLSHSLEVPVSACNASLDCSLKVLGEKGLKSEGDHP